MKINHELIEACQRQERKAQFELYRQCYGLLMGACLRYEKNKEDAEFVLNKAFYKILLNLEKYDRKVPFEAWARRVTINTLIDEYRKKSRSKLDFVESPMDFAPISVMDYNEADQKFDAEELEEMIRKLPPTSQKVFNLHIIDGYNHKEIGEKLGISEGTSKWHLSNARKKLKGMMKKILNHVAVFL